MRKKGQRKFKLLKTQERRAKSQEAYAVVFFPKINNFMKATVSIYGVKESLANSPEAAIIKFCDRIHSSKGGETIEKKWKTHHHAGHRVRKIRITDMGDA